MEYVALVVIVALIEYMFFTMQVGRARIKYEIKAPATTGNEIFERFFRVQQNTLEQLILFIPSIYLFAVYVHEITAAVLGLFFIIGRALFFKHYTTSPDKRAAGMILGMLANTVLLLGALIGILISII